MQELESDLNEGWQRQIANRFQVARLYEFQRVAIQAVIDGMDSLVVIPTGGGKSYCYAGAAAIADGLTLVVSPLIALMRDQVEQLSGFGLRVAALDSLQAANEKLAILKEIEGQSLDLLIVSPERLALPSFRELLGRVKLSLIAVDEAHCVNHWGRDFRPDYARLGTYLREISDAPIMALTATATAEDRRQIQESLKMSPGSRLVREYRPRTNLKFKIFRARSMDEHSDLLLQACLSQTGSGIVYAATRKRVGEIAAMLRRAGITDLGYYHGGLDAGQRQRQQQRFLQGENRITVATNAFGLGIHKADIRFVFHANMPGSLEAYVQELGRAGRDGEAASCYLFYGPRDYFLQKFMIEKQFPSADHLSQVYQQLLIQVEAPSGAFEARLRQSISDALGLDEEIVMRVFDFLYRDDVLQRVEIVSDQWFEGSATYIQTQWGDPRPLASLLTDLDKRRQQRFDRLNAIHRMVKQQQNVQEVIEAYFE